MRLNEWKESGNYFDFQGYKIFYKTEGSGFPLLCIHGFPTASFDWSPIWNELTKRFQVITLDMIGFGFSDKPKNFNYSIHTQADVYETLLKFLKVKQAHIFAHDYGVTVCQELLARFNSRLQKNDDQLMLHSICFLNGGLFPEMHRPRLIQKLLLTPIGFILSRFFTKKSFEKSFSEVFGPKTKPTQQELDDFWILICYNEGNLISHKLIRYIPERIEFRERWVNAIIHSKIPIRLINGPFDPVSGIHMAEYYKKIIPNPDIVLLNEGIGHYPQVEDPANVLKYFLEFIEKFNKA